MIKKGIVLAGGTGSRLNPLTKAVNKQLLPIHDKPMIFYPLSVLMLANIRNILMIVNPGQINNFQNLLGDGSRFGIQISYVTQDRPRGLPDAFNLGKKFIANDNVALILGDNFFYGQSLTKKLEKSSIFNSGCSIFLKDVNQPQNFGIAKIKNNKIEKIIEKPKQFISRSAITGLYFFDKNVTKFTENLRPSKRSELEITDLINLYKKENKLKFELIGRGAIWSDAGQIEDLANVSNYVRSIEKVQGVKIACLEEIAFTNGWISIDTLEESANKLRNTSYGTYLFSLVSELK